MRVLLDENLPARLKNLLPEHHIATVADMNWSGTNDGELLRLASSQFDVLLTADRRLQHQQNLSGVQCAVVVLAMPNNSLPAIRLLLASLQALLSGEVQRGSVTIVGTWRVP